MEDRYLQTCLSVTSPFRRSPLSACQTVAFEGFFRQMLNPIPCKLARELSELRLRAFKEMAFLGSQETRSRSPGELCLRRALYRCCCGRKQESLSLRESSPRWKEIPNKRERERERETETATETKTKTETAMYPHF